jgi:iron complex outermembrane receptor protein
MRRQFVIKLILLLNFWVAPFSLAQEMEAEERLIEQLKSLGLEELTEVRIFDPEAGLAARKVQRLTETAAALFVITQEDIRRAGITHLAEALRMVPGIQVARIDANKWAISARGLNGQYTSKLLVMVDGRSVYTQLRSEVYWDVQDLLIEDIEHIEVIRGPGASLWGANAVNGVINIVTKSAKTTQGTLLTTHFGSNEEKAIVGIRYGGELENGLAYRIYGKFYDHDNFVNAQGQEHNDNWDMKRGGFRLDWENSTDNTFTFQGNAYKGVLQQKLFEANTFSILNDQANVEGLNLLGRWQRDFTNGDLILQTYLDHTEREDASLGEVRKTYDIDFQHRWQRNDKQEFIWGLGFRHTRDHITSFIGLQYEPEKRGDNLFSAFLQGEFLLHPDLKLTAGTKVERNDYTGFEIQPTLRGLWTLNPQHSLWAAISRAVRTPSRSDDDAHLNMIDPLLSLQINALGSRNFQSEELLAYELGYRFKLAKQFLFDTSLFFHQYDQLRNINGVNFNPLTRPPTMTFKTNNNMEGEIFGLELATHWQVFDTWRLVSTYSYLQVQLHLNSEQQSLLGETEEHETPHHQATLRSLLTLPHHLEFDTALYYVDNISKLSVPNYLRADIRLGWKPLSALDLSLGVRNLFDKQHREFGDGFTGNTILASEVPRTFYLQLKYQFE